MRRYPLTGFCLVLCCVSLMEANSFAQELVSPQPDVTIKLFNPAALGLDSAASVTSIEGWGLYFGLKSAGGTVIRLTVTTKPVVVNSQERLKAFLSENGILPDTNAISFVYYLNPDLASVRKIEPRTELQLPIVLLADATPDQSLPRLPIISLVVNGKLKNALREDINTFRSSVNKKRNDFGPKVADDLKSIDVSLDQFFEDRVSSSQEMLEQVQANVRTLHSMFAKYSRKSNVFRKGPKLVLSPEDSSEFNWIRTDLVEKVEASNEGNPNVNVEVKTFKDGIEVSHFIICYIPELKYKPNECERSFPQQSSPTEHSLSVATYNFWAIRPGNPSPASDVRTISVRHNQQQPVELTIISRPKQD